MSAETNTTGPDILEFGLSASDSWYPVPLDDREPTSNWARELVAQIAPGTAAEELRARIDDLRYRLTLQGNPFQSAAMYLPRAQSGVIDCLLTYQVSELGPDDTPESFLRDAESQRDRREPGLVIRDVQTWRGAVPAGELVGARTLNTYRELGADSGWVEERTVFGVYPPGANQSVILVFTTSKLDAFADMAAETGAIVETLRVTRGVAA